MTARTRHTPFHPRWYRERMSTYWWVHRPQHLKFILRELSSVAVAYGVIMTLFQIGALKEGPQAYAEFQQQLQSPLILIISFIGFLFVVFHAVTWFNLTPRAMVVRVRGKRLPDFMIAAPNYFVWAVISGVVAWFVMGA